jgi:NAD(P)-dependent dehydrogenase (short-subunit alcohol dehydrogenase family)
LVSGIGVHQKSILQSYRFEFILVLFPMQIEHSIVLITGASSGIGLSLIKQFLQKGAIVCAFSRRGVPEDVKDQFPNTLMDYIGDIGKVQDVKACMDTISERFGSLSIVIANAGMAHFENLAEMNDEIAEEMVSTNLLGVFYTIKYAFQLLSNVSGPKTIVGIHSIAATTVFNGASVYSATKAGTLAMMRSFREEARSHGISVIDVLPGATRTPIWSKDMLNDRGNDMMDPDTIAKIIISALEQGRTDEDSITHIDEIVIRPWTGNL